MNRNERKNSHLSVTQAGCSLGCFSPARQSVLKGENVRMMAMDKLIGNQYMEIINLYTTAER